MHSTYPENAQSLLRENTGTLPRPVSQISHSAIVPVIDYRLALAVRRELAGDDSLPATCWRQRWRFCSKPFRTCTGG